MLAGSVYALSAGPWALSVTPARDPKQVFLGGLWEELWKLSQLWALQRCSRGLGSNYCNKTYDIFAIIPLIS